MKRGVVLPILCCLLLSLGAVMAHAAPSVKISGTKVVVPEGVTDAIMEEIKKGVGEAKDLEFDLRNIDSNEDLAKICAAYPGMKTLTVFGRQNLTSVAPVAALKQLQTLDLSASSAADFSPLSSLTGLTSLKVSSAIMGPDLTWMSGLTKLEKLDVRGGKNLVSFAGVPAAPQLRQAVFSNTFAADLTPLKAFSGLKSLDLRVSAVTDLAPLGDLASLESLNLEEAKVKDLSPLAKCAALRTLFISKMKNLDHSSLGKVTQLTTLFSRQNSMQDISWLARLSNLQTLSLNRENITDYNPLAKLTPEYLVLADMNSEAVDLGFLSGMTSLKRLSLKDLKNVSSLASLQNLTALTSLELVKLECKDGEAIPLEQIKKFQKLVGLTLPKGMFTDEQLTGFANPKITVQQR